MSLQTLKLPGFSAQPLLSKDGSKLAFVSWDSEPGKPQAYVLDIASHKRTRWTFTDGWIYRPFLGAQGMYYSNNSEEKEEFTSPAEILNSKKESPSLENWLINGPSDANEIYVRSAPSSEVRRLSRHKGQDLIWPSTQMKSWVSSEAEGPTLHIFSSNKKQILNRTLNPQSERLASVILDDSEGGLYLAFNANKQASLERVSKAGTKPAILINRPGQITAMAINPEDTNELWMSANFADSANWDIYVFNIQDKCLSRVTTHANWDLDPTVKGKTLYFASRRSGTLQIQKADVDLTNRSCL